MTAATALLLAAELIRLGAAAYRDGQDEIKVEDMGIETHEAMDELDAYLKSKGA